MFGKRLGNENETISSLCRLMLCVEDLWELSALPHEQTEMSAASLSVKYLLHGNQRDVKSMFIVLELRKCFSLQKGDDHSEPAVHCCLHYRTLISAIYQKYHWRTVLKCLTKMGALCFE